MNFPIKIDEDWLKIVKQEPTVYLEKFDFESYQQDPSTYLDKVNFAAYEQEPTLNSGEFETFEVEYVDEDSETERMQESRTSNSNKSYSTQNAKRTRATKVQLERMLTFIRSHSDLIGTVRYNTGKTSENEQLKDVWDVLAAELNAIGPPLRTKAQWKKTWTAYNNNHQIQKVAAPLHGGRKRIRLETSADEKDRSGLLSLGLSSLDDPDASNASSSKTTKDDMPNLEANDDREDNFQSLILKKMDSAAERQIIHGNQLERLNQNLEKLIEILTAKFT